MLVYYFGINNPDITTCLDVSGYKLAEYYGNARVKQEGDNLIFADNNVSVVGMVVLLKK